MCVWIDDTSSYAWFLLAKEFGSTSAIEAVARAEKQLPIAQQNLSLLQIADMYFKGDELPQDKGEAERWLRIAANRGDPQAQVRLAATLIGHPTPEYDEAFKLCTEAARTGNPAAEYCLGQLYQKGLGTSKNPAEALKWFEAAATQGHLQATESAALMLANGDAGKQDPGKAFIYLFVLIANGDQSAVPQAVKLKAAMSKKEWKKVEEKLRQSGFDPFKVEAALAKGPA